MTDPYNTLRDDPDVIEFVEPPVETTGRFRAMIDLHRERPDEYDATRRRESASRPPE